MTQIATTIDQGKKLIELGINPKTADMWWNFYSITYDNGHAMELRVDHPWLGNFNWFNRSDNIPAWSLPALLELIRSTEEHAKLTVSPLNGYKLSTEQHRSNTTYDSPIDAAVDMIEWLVKDGYIIKEK